MSSFELRELILKHIREVLEEAIDEIKNCHTDIDREKNKARRETLFEIHKWINEETR